MKTAIALIGVLVLSSLVLFGLWRLLPSGSGSSNGLDAGAARPETPAGVPHAAEVASTEAPDSSGRTAQAAAKDVEGGTGEESWAKQDSLWLHGSIEATGPCSRDDLLYVYALERNADAGDLFDFLAPRDASDDEGGNDDGRKKEDEHLVLSRRKVESDGSFELPLPPGTRYAHLIVLGRTLYMPSARSFEIGAASSIVLAPQCGGAIEGRIEVSGGPSPAAEAKRAVVRLDAKLTGALTVSAGYHRRVVAEKDGSFSIYAVPAARAYTLDVSDERYAPRRVEISALVSGETRPVQVRLSPGARARGRVVDEAGTPVAGAKVKGGVKMMFARNLGEREAKCDAEGNFELDALPPGDVSIQASADGYLDSQSQLRVLAEGEEQSGLELELERGKSIAGVLRWSDGTPAAKVRVRASYDPEQVLAAGGLQAQRGASSDAETDEQGRFELRGLASARFDLRASAKPPGEVADRFFAKLQAGGGAPPGAADEDPAHPARVFDADWVASQQSVKSESTGLELVLEPPRGIAGHVIDERGEPVTNFRVRAVQMTDTRIGSLGRDRQEKPFEDAAGRFYLSGLLPGKQSLYALADGFSPGDPVQIVLPDQEREEIEIRIQHAATVSGTVRSPLGTPVAGATVAIDTGEPFWKSQMTGEPEAPSAVTAGDGRYLLEGLPPGSVTLAVQAENYARGAHEAIDLAPAQHLDGVDLYLTEGGTLTGEVYDKNGERAAGRVVQTVRMSDMSIHFSETDGRGEFHLEHLEAGSWQVQSMPAQNRLANIDGAEEGALGDLISEMKTAVAEVVEGETVHVLLGAPPADPIEVHGRITHHGEPYGKAMVVFYSEGKNMLQKMRNATANAAGEFTLTLDGPGKYVATVQKFGEQLVAQSSIEFQVEIPEVKEYELELAVPLGRISGSLRASGGKKIASERVNLYPAGPASSGSFFSGQYFEVRTDEDGSFDLQGLRPGTYSVAAGGMPVGGMFGGDAHYGRIVREVEVHEDEWVRGVDFLLEEPGRVQVRVLDAAGKPVAGAAIFARNEAGELVELFSMTSTDNQGLREYGGLAPGRYTFCARKQGFASEESAPVKVELGETRDVALVLQEGTMLWVKLLNEKNEGVQATISVLDENGRQVGSMVALGEIMELLGGEGFSMSERRIGPLPPGNYRVIARTPDGQEESKPVSLRRQSERRLTIHFRD